MGFHRLWKRMSMLVRVVHPRGAPGVEMPDKSKRTPAAMALETVRYVGMSLSWKTK